MKKKNTKLLRGALFFYTNFYYFFIATQYALLNNLSVMGTGVFFCQPTIEAQAIYL
jgi:hypothetical protein